MNEEEARKVKVTVKDRRVASQGGAVASPAVTPPSRASDSEDLSDLTNPAEAQAAAASPSSPEFGAEAAAAPEPDYLVELQRERADFENYRKRMMREVSASGARAKAVLAEKMLPILDNFELAIAHGEGGEGVALVFRELKTALESEGLQEISAAGERFDPNVHEAVMSVDDPSIAEPIVKEVYRRGYLFGDQLLRAAMVVVARPTGEPSAAAVNEHVEE